MDQMVAYPDLVFNDDWLNGLYSGVSTCSYIEFTWYSNHP